MTDIIQGESWHLDKKIPIALIITIILNTGSFVWWMSSLDAAVDVLKRDQERIDIRLKESEQKNNGSSDRLIRLEEQVSQQTKMLERILVKLESK